VGLAPGPHWAVMKAQALHRSETIAATVDGRDGFVRRPSLVVRSWKAAAHNNRNDLESRRQ